MALSKKQILIALSTFVLLLVTIISIIASLATQNSHKNISDPATHVLVKTSCDTTLYPDLCYTSISQLPKDATTKIKTFKDVIDITLHITIVATQDNYLNIKKIMESHKNLTEQENTALHDCLETADDTLEELHEAQADLHANNPSVKKSVAQHADDVMTLLSGAMTNQDTCLEGFTYNKTERKIGDLLNKGEMHVFKMCSNVLSMVKELAGKNVTEHRKLKENGNNGWPEWFSSGDRRLLQAVDVVPNVTVAADGSGDYSTITEAVAAAPNKSETRFIIKIKAGVYRENVEVPKKKWNIMFLGDGRTKTIITGNRNVVDGSTTFHSATVAAVGQRFLARDITFENTAGPSKHQAVALRVGSDLSAFYNCDMLGYQDTLYVHSLRQFYVKCIITGTVDFIFGNGAAVLQDCDIHARRPNSGQKNMITAQGRDDPNQNTGIVIQKCRIGATKDLEATKSEFPTFLGRPWKTFSRTVVMQSTISDVVEPVGWHEWHGDFALDTLFYAEYQNTGPGAGTAKRVPWKGFRVFTNASEAEAFSAENFISGSHWLNSTGFPFSLGL